MKNLTKKNKNLIVGLLGVVIFFITYYMGYQSYSAKNEEISTEIGTKEAYLAELKEYNSKLKIYEEGIAESKTNIGNLLAKLPLNVEEEDFLVYMMGLNEAVGAELSNISFNEPEMLQEFECTIDGQNKVVSGYNVTVSTAGKFTYPQLKEYLTYVYDKTSEVTYVDNLSVTYNASEANLDASVSVGKFFINYDGGVYVPVKMPDVPFGVADPFATNAKTTEE